MKAFYFSLSAGLFGLAVFMTWSIWQNNLPVDLLERHIPRDATEVLVIPQPGALASGIDNSGDSLSLWPQIGIFKSYNQVFQGIATTISESKDGYLMALAGADENWLLIIQPEHSIFHNFSNDINGLWPGTNWQEQGNNTWKNPANEWHGTLRNGLILITNQPEWIKPKSSQPEEDPSYQSFVRSFESRGKNAMVSWLSRESEDWLCLDLSLKNGALLINGYIPTKGMKLIPGTEMSSLPSLPEKASELNLLPIPDSESLWRNNEYYYQAKDSLAIFNRLISDLESNWSTDLRSVMTTWPSDRLIAFDFEGHDLVLIEHRSLTNTLAQLESISDSSKTYEHLGQTIKRLKSAVPARLLIHHSLNDSITCYAIDDKKVIFSPSTKSLEDFFDDMALGRTATFPQSDLTNAYLNRRSSALFINEAQNHYLPKGIAALNRVNENSGSVVNLIAESSDRALLNMVVYNRKQRNSFSKTGEEWSISLDATFTRKPELVNNHYSGEKEILIQDTDNHLYLITASGSVLWKKPLKEPLLGKVHQIDLFKNGKLQLLFATSGSIHLLDRNGNPVAGFPIALPSKASSSLGVFDYDKDRNYRIVIGCEDGIIYNYGSDGKATSGWKYRKGDESVSWLDHFKIGSKDYLVCLGSKGEIQLLQRNGRERQKLKVRADGWKAGSVYLSIQSTINESGILFADEEGAVRMLNFGGKVNKLFDTGIPNSQITFEDLENDGAPEVLQIAGKKLIIRALSGDKLWEAEFAELAEIPGIYRFGRGDNRVGIQAGNEIWLLNSRGDVSPGFPLIGNTPLTIGDLKRNGKLQMIYGKAGRYLIDQEVN